MRRSHLVGRKFADLQAEADILADRHVRPDGVALEDHRHAAPLRRHDGVGGGEGVAVDLDRARRRRHEAGDHAQGRGLAAARGAEQGDELALLQRQVEVVDGVEAAEAARKVAQDELGHALFAPPGAA